MQGIQVSVYARFHEAGITVIPVAASRFAKRMEKLVQMSVIAEE